MDMICQVAGIWPWVTKTSLVHAWAEGGSDSERKAGGLPFVARCNIGEHVRPRARRALFSSRAASSISARRKDPVSE